MSENSPKAASPSAATSAQPKETRGRPAQPGNAEPRAQPVAPPVVGRAVEDRGPVAPAGRNPRNSRGRPAQPGNVETTRTALSRRRVVGGHTVRRIAPVAPAAQPPETRGRPAQPGNAQPRGQPVAPPVVTPPAKVVPVSPPARLRKCVAGQLSLARNNNADSLPPRRHRRHRHHNGRRNRARCLRNRRRSAGDTPDAPTQAAAGIDAAEASRSCRAARTASGETGARSCREAAAIATASASTGSFIQYAAACAGATGYERAAARPRWKTCDGQAGRPEEGR